MNMAWIRKLLNLNTILFSLLAVGCSYYSLAGNLPPGIRSVYIPLFENETTVANVSETLTTQISNQISDQNILELVNFEESSQSLLKGVIISILDTPYTFNENEQVSDYRFTIEIEVSWINTLTQEVFFEKKFTSFGIYNIDLDPSIDGLDNDNDGLIDGDDSDEIGDSRDLAINVALNKIAVDIVNEILGTW